MPTVKLVYDNESREFSLPAEMGTPRDDQFLGTPLDRLVEACGRISYDSVGRGRPSDAFHKHLRDSGHRSVHRHAVTVLHITTDGWGDDQAAAFFGAVLGRPGVHLSQYDGHQARLTCTMQSALEWTRYRPVARHSHSILGAGLALGQLAAMSFQKAAPLAFERPDDITAWRGICALDPISCRLDDEPPWCDEEAYASLFLADISRGCADELLRHVHRCAASPDDAEQWEHIPSVESSRYVDYGMRPWVPHPLIRDTEFLLRQFHLLEKQAKAAYSGLAHTMGADPATRDAGIKQIRGAARGVLGMAYGTRLIFTAALSQWRHLLSLRDSGNADMEMQELARDVRACLEARWPGRFGETRP